MQDKHKVLVIGVDSIFFKSLMFDTRSLILDTNASIEYQGSNIEFRVKNLRAPAALHRAVRYRQEQTASHLQLSGYEVQPRRVLQAEA